LKTEVKTKFYFTVFVKAPLKLSRLSFLTLSSQTIINVTEKTKLPT